MANTKVNEEDLVSDKISDEESSRCKECELHVYYQRRDYLGIYLTTLDQLKRGISLEKTIVAEAYDINLKKDVRDRNRDRMLEYKNAKMTIDYNKNDIEQLENKMKQLEQEFSVINDSSEKKIQDYKGYGQLKQEKERLQKENIELENKYSKLHSEEYAELIGALEKYKKKALDEWESYGCSSHIDFDKIIDDLNFDTFHFKTHTARKHEKCTEIYKTHKNTGKEIEPNYKLTVSPPPPPPPNIAKPEEVKQNIETAKEKIVSNESEKQYLPPATPNIPTATQAATNISNKLNITGSLSESINSCIPVVKLPTLPKVPTISLPKLSLPKIPTISIPKIGFPKLPDFKIPDIKIPGFKLPKFDKNNPLGGKLPEFKLPEFKLPKFEIPTINIKLPKCEQTTLDFTSISSTLDSILTVENKINSVKQNINSVKEAKTLVSTIVDDTKNFKLPL